MKRIVAFAALLLALVQGAAAHDTAAPTTDSEATQEYCRWAPPGFWQPRKVWPAEVEVYIGGTYPVLIPKNHEGMGGGSLGLEYRHNLPGLPFALGGVANLYTVYYKDKPVPDSALPTLNPSESTLRGSISYDERAERYTLWSSGECSTQSVGGAFFGPLVEYSLARGAGFSPFASIATGFAFVGEHQSVFIRPKIGIELGRWVRFSGSLYYSGTNTLSTSFTVGLVIGGWARSW